MDQVRQDYWSVTDPDCGSLREPNGYARSGPWYGIDGTQEVVGRDSPPGKDVWDRK